MYITGREIFLDTDQILQKDLTLKEQTKKDLCNTRYSFTISEMDRVIRKLNLQGRILKKTHHAVKLTFIAPERGVHFHLQFKKIIR